jgi:putative ABC transport system permease protein
MTGTAATFDMRWRKVAADFAAYRVQIVLIAIVLVLGAAGVVAALDAQAVLRREIDASFRGAKAPDLVLWYERVDNDLLAAVAAQDGVAAVAARRVVFTRLALADGSWLPMRLSIVPSVAAAAVAQVHAHGPASDQRAAGEDSGLWLEQSGQGMLGAASAQNGRATLRLRSPGGAIVSVPLAGWLHDAGVAPSTQERMFYGYATPAVAAMLGHSAEADQMLVKMAQRGAKEDAVELGHRLSAWGKESGRPNQRVEVLPAHHPHALLMTAALRVLGVLAGMAFLCSAALAVYMVSLWMKREVRVVGILKTLGATTAQIAALYAALVLPVLLLAAALAVPLGNALGMALVRSQAVSLNLDIASWQVPIALRRIEVAVALLLPLLAMALPIWRAARLTPREAMMDAGITAAAGGGRLRAAWQRRLLSWPGHLRWTLALRNSFRRPWRLSLIVLALASGGALLLTTQHNYKSLMQVIDVSLAQQGHDIEALLQRPAPAAELEAIARSVPDVVVAEAWRRNGAALAGDSNARFAVLAYPPDTKLFTLPVLQGRLPRADASDEVLVTRTMLELDRSITLGGRINLRHRDREVALQVVGLVEEIGQATLYTSFAGYQNITALGDAANALRIKAKSGEIDAVQRALDQALLDARHTPSQVLSRVVFRDALDEHFKVVGDVIQVVALAAALIGAIVLAASSSMNVLERTREIGVLRALGATPRNIAAIFVAEAAAIALLGGALALMLSIVLTLVLNHSASVQLLHVAVPLRFSWPGLAQLGLGLLVVVGAVAAAVAAVLRQPTHEALAYE